MDAGPSQGPSDHLTPKENYRILKKKFKFLVYENECYQEELRNLQRKLLKLSRDKNFLLDRLMNFEKPGESSDESDTSIQTRSEEPKKPKKKSRNAASRKRGGEVKKEDGGPAPKVECLDKKLPPPITSPHHPPPSH